jgi:hypothetical protein
MMTRHDEFEKSKNVAGRIKLLCHLCIILLVLLILPAVRPAQRSSSGGSLFSLDEQST